MGRSGRVLLVTTAILLSEVGRRLRSCFRDAGVERCGLGDRVGVTGRFGWDSSIGMGSSIGGVGGGGDSCEKFLGPGCTDTLRADSGAEVLRLWLLVLEDCGRPIVFDLLSMSAAGCKTRRTDSWCASVCRELSMVLVLRIDKAGDMLRSGPNGRSEAMGPESVLILFCRSATLSRL